MLCFPKDYQNKPPVQTKEQWNEYNYKTNLCLSLRHLLYEETFRITALVNQTIL